MKQPNLQEEKKLWKKGYKRVAGLDESGRGPLCGPVVAAAVLVSTKPGLVSVKPGLAEIRDSKKLSAKKREEFYKILTTHPAIEWGIGRVSERVIDRINILQATRLAMKRAVGKLKSKPDFLILDGKISLDLEIPQKSIIKADEKVFACACASIIAKITRDGIMKKHHRKYPQYEFDRHKGYPTSFHRAGLKKYGACPIHRRSFKPVREVVKYN